MASSHSVDDRVKVKTTASGGSPSRLCRSQRKRAWSSAAIGSVNVEARSTLGVGLTTDTYQNNVGHVNVLS
ncbi:hypothetical protein DPMN_049431 [Dreissena polymorpha]|uniref:Uncharacterized protein n=1 Tax=Dreissena polymorpha TaxID=45954 RepID=A0A9D4CFP4_DREPO|nr:hypothetical protein DPMN_049431 [Dreissena polymorpha]